MSSPPSLPVQDLERARAFYRDKLGLEPVEERTGGVRHMCGTTEFHLFSSAGVPSGKSTHYPSKRTGELGAFFIDSEGNLIGIARPVRDAAAHV